MTVPARYTVIAASGDWGSVEFAVRLSGRIPGKEFLTENLDAKGQAKFNHLFHQMAATGRLRDNRFRPEAEHFFAFSHEVRNVQIRFPCFNDGRRWIVTHGFAKQGAQKGRGKWRQSEIDRAIEIQAEYLILKQRFQAASKEQK